MLKLNSKEVGLNKEKIKHMEMAKKKNERREQLLIRLERDNYQKRITAEEYAKGKEELGDTINFFKDFSYEENGVVKKPVSLSYARLFYVIHARLKGTPYARMEATTFHYFFYEGKISNYGANILTDLFRYFLPVEHWGEIPALLAEIYEENQRVVKENLSKR